MSYLTIETEADPIDIVKAIVALTNSIDRTVDENYQFAEAIIATDPEAGEKIIMDTESTLAAAQTLTNFAYDLLGKERDVPLDEYDV